MNQSLDFDANGSTAVDARVLDVLVRTLREAPGNASAAHPAGRRAQAAIEAARASVAAYLGAEPDEISFTSGGTESNNWAVSVTAEEARDGHVLVSAIEHKSVLEPAQALARRGFRVELLAPARDGALRVEELERRLAPDTRVVALMTANNETGVIQPIRAVGELCRARGIRFHTDAVAALGKVPLDVRELACDSLALSSHKAYAPKGTGVLYMRRERPIPPYVLGCGQQCGRRSGTENTAGAAAFGHALALLRAGQLVDVDALGRLRDELWQGIRARFPTAERNGTGAVLPNTLNVHFPGRRATELQAGLASHGFSVAMGAAASTGAPSHVLRAMGCSDEHARSSLRFSLGAHTDRAAVELLLAALEQVLAQPLRKEIHA